MNKDKSPVNRPPVPPKPKHLTLNRRKNNKSKQ